MLASPEWRAILQFCYTYRVMFNISLQWIILYNNTICLQAQSGEQFCNLYTAHNVSIRPNMLR